MTDVYVARQPIFNTGKQVIAYELLYRSSLENFFSHNDPHQASLEVVDNTLHNLGFSFLTADKKAFINMTRRMLVDNLAQVLPPDQVVLEILENIEPDPEVITACKDLKDAGYTLALDDFVFSANMQPLIDLADIIKVDFLVTDAEHRVWYTRHVDPNRIRLLAEKVETHDDYKEAIDLGYAYFQGYFFAKPEVMTGKQIPRHKIHYLRLLQTLNRPDFEFREVENIVKQEVSLSVRLLRYLNSAALGIRHKISSIKQALTLLGERSLRKWAYVVTMTAMADDKPPELILTCLIRARFCELLAQKAGVPDANYGAFLVGLLSAVQAIVERPMEEIFETLSVSEDIQNALNGKDTPLGNTFSLMSAYEKGQWADIPVLAAKIPVDGDTLPTIYREAIIWADQAFQG